MFTKIDELIWTDEKYKKLSDDGKFLFLYVLSCPHRNILGFYFLPIPYGSFDLGWENERFSKGLRELLNEGFINYNFNTNIIFIKNFLKYNPLENPNQVKGAIKALQVLPTNSIDSELVDYLKTVEKPFIEPLLKLLDERLGKQEDVDVDVEEDIEEDKEEDKEEIKTSPVPYEKIKDLFNDICKSFSTIRSLSSKRKEHIRARWKQYDYQIEVFEELFRKAESSDFLKGINKRKWKANFDWLINDNNMAKVLEGRYKNEEGEGNGECAGDTRTENQGSERKVDLSHIGFKGTGEIDDSDLI